VGFRFEVWFGLKKFRNLESCTENPWLPRLI
jgi:hypothetical protein